MFSKIAKIPEANAHHVDWLYYFRFLLEVPNG